MLCTWQQNEFVFVLSRSMQKSDSVTTIIKVKASAIYTNVYTLQIGPDEIGLFK